MLTSDSIQRTIGTTKQHGAKNAVFYTFFSKKATPPFSPTDCTQTISAKIPCLSFTGKERDEETGYGYFGARYMDHELLTSFISVDRYADKYPSISPYAYCAWNPIRITDPTGDTIVIKGDNANYLYVDGKLYNHDGSKAKGADKFAKASRKALEKCSKKGLSCEIQELQNSSNNIVITRSSDGSNRCRSDSHIDESNGVGCGSTIEFNPESTGLKLDGKRPAYVGLAHELGHAYDANEGGVLKNPNGKNPYITFTRWDPVPDNPHIYAPTTYFFDLNELNAMRFENRVRSKRNQRVTYDGFDITPYNIIMK